MPKLPNACAACALVLSQVAIAKDAPVLSPSSSWQLSYDADSCRLGRMFGSGTDTVGFYIERFGPDDAFQMVVAGSPLRELDSSKVYYQFGAGEPRQSSPPLKGQLGTLAPSFVFSPARFAPTGKEGIPDWWKDEGRVKLPLVTVEEERAITWVGFGGKEGDEVRLSLGSMAKPMEALRGCVDELMTHWGIDVEAHETLTRRAAPATYPGAWIRFEDYPPEMLAKGMSGLVAFRLMVNAEGDATACHIQQSTRPKQFDDAVCSALMKRARFAPALDATGKPIASFWLSSARFNTSG
jgi:TonB family protein